MQTISDVGIIILAGGSGSRFGSNKLLEKLNEIPVLAHSVKNFREVCQDDRIVLICPENLIAEYRDILNNTIGPNKISFASGGETRAHSVFNGLQFFRKPNPQYCAIHDAARPLTTSALLLKCLTQCMEKGSAVSARKITDTIKSADCDKRVTSNIERSLLWAVETPQIFRFEEIFMAYQYVLENNISVTDDAGAMETIGKDVFLFENPNPNIKITFAGDIDIAESILKAVRTD